MSGSAGARDGPTLVVAGDERGSQPGGLVLIVGREIEVLDRVATSGLTRSGDRLERTLAGVPPRVAHYDHEGLRAIDRLPPASSAPTATGDTSRLPARVDIPLGTPTAVVEIDGALADGLRIGGSVNAARAAETTQERAVREAGVVPSALWGVPPTLSIPDCHVDLRVDNPIRLASGERVLVPYLVRNLGGSILATAGPNPVYLSARWFESDGGVETMAVTHFRNPLERPVPPGSAHHGSMTLGAPPTPGSYSVQFTLLQEGVRWFADADDRSAYWAAIEVSDGLTADEATT